MEVGRRLGYFQYGHGNGEYSPMSYIECNLFSNIPVDIPRYRHFEKIIRCAEFSHWS